MLLTVELRKPARPALVIPELALTQVGTDAFVYRVKPDATVEQVKVATGARRLGEVEVTDGLAPGDRIVVEGTVKLRPGARVAAVERSAAATTASQAPDAP
jgi:membrane fusion protein (multidrug efflux system)